MAEHSHIPSLMAEQTVLSWRNILSFLLSGRNKPSMVLQLTGSCFFVFFIFCSQNAFESRLKFISPYSKILDPDYNLVGGILPCEVGFFIQSPCYDFVWCANSSSSGISGIVKNIMANNPGRAIPPSKVKEFATPADVDEWLAANPLRCTGAIHFFFFFLLSSNSSVQTLGYGIQTNSTSGKKRGRYEDHTLKFQIPLQVAAEREIARYLLGDSNLSWTIGLKEFAQPVILTFSVLGSSGATFFLAAAMFGFVFQLGSIVAEKELKLRQAMSMMVLYDSAYWLTWLTWDFFHALLSVTLLLLFGMAFQFNLFLRNSFAIVFFLFFLFQFNLVGFSFMLSTFMSKSSSATTVGFFVYIIGFLTQLVTTSGFPYTDQYSKTSHILWSIFPPNVFAQGLNLLGAARYRTRSRNQLV